MIPRLTYDTETRSEIDLGARGLDVYSRHYSTEMVCATVKTDNFEGSASFLPSSEGREALEREMLAIGLNVVSPDVIIATLLAAETIVASNAPFDATVTARLLGVEIPKERWSCTAARCRRHGLPGALEHGAAVLRLPEGKDMEGNRLNAQLRKPRPTWTKWQRMTPEERARAKRKDGGAKWFEDVSKLARNALYNARDTRVSHAMDKLVPELEPSERAIWLHVWRMNETGIPVDMELINGAVAMAEDSRREVTDRVRTYTGGMIQSLQAPGQLVAWAARYGYNMPSWAKDAVAEAIADPGCPEAVRVVALARQEAGKGSIAKYETAAEMVSADGRLRYQVEYSGTAPTMRLAGRGVQPLNLPRPKIEADKSAALADIKAGRQIRVPEWKLHYDPEKALHAIRTSDLKLLREIGDPEEILSDRIRSMIKAPPGKKIVSPDLSAIEARGVFWLTNCTRALEAYRRNECLYCQLASTMFGFSVNKKDHPEERQYGKVGILQCGYGSGVNRVAVANKLSEEMAQKIVSTYRSDYSEVPIGWRELEHAAVSAVLNPGQVYSACSGRVHFVFEAGWLRICRPSGVWMYLPDAGIDSEGRLFYHYQHPKFGWISESIWGGVLINFVVQGFCRELMYAGEMRIAQDPRFELFLQCYDSLSGLTDAEPSADLCKHMIDEMTAPPPWAPDFPFIAHDGTRAAEGKPKDRYS